MANMKQQIKRYKNDNVKRAKNASYKSALKTAIKKLLAEVEAGNKEAAEKFVEWYTSADMQKELNETLGSLPTRSSVLKELVDDGTIANAGAMLEASELIASPFPNGVPAYYAEMSSAMYNAINKMALGELTPEKAYEEMSSALDQLLKEQ